MPTRITAVRFHRVVEHAVEDGGEQFVLGLGAWHAGPPGAGEAECANDSGGPGREGPESPDVRGTIVATDQLVLAVCWFHWPVAAEVAVPVSSCLKYSCLTWAKFRVMDSIGLSSPEPPVW